MKGIVNIAAAATALCLLAATSSAVAQTPAPTENLGVSAKLIGALELAPEIDGVQGRQLRMRVVTLMPGGFFAVHSHKDRPSVEYLVGGSATEYRGGVPKVYKEGDAVIADKDTMHWWRNDGSVPAVFLAVDVFKPQ